MAIAELRQEYYFMALLKLAKISKSTYHYILKRMAKPAKYEKECQEIRQIFEDNKGRYGYRRITLELRNRGYTINHKTVRKLMKQEGLICKVRMKKYCSFKGEVGQIAPNLLQREFKADKPNEKWVTDVTEFSLFGKKLYLSPILDLYNSELVSYSISERPVFAQIMSMLKKAFDKVPDNTGLLLHSDQGWQYRMAKYRKELQQKGVRQSMSRKGNCLDNSVMENFFGLLKSELLYLQDFASLEDFKEQLEEYLDYYNNHRIKSKLNGLSPVQYRIQSARTA